MFPILEEVLQDYAIWGAKVSKKGREKGKI
jgi:hypothetical protein